MPCVAAGAAVCGPHPARRQANRLKPHWYAWQQLWDYGDTYQMNEAGCLRWNYAQHAWYTRCGLPQNAVLYPPHRAISVRD